MRALANQGTIEFRLDDAFSVEIFADDVHWIGRNFRVYEGLQSPDGYVDDLDLIYEGRITDVNHDTTRATVRTGDASVDLDIPFVSEMYPDDALASIAGKPRPEILGTVTCIEPVLSDAANLIYDVSTVPVNYISEVRVGGIPWEPGLAPPPGEGEWDIDPQATQIALGSATLGGDVRCDVEGLAVSGTGGLGRVVFASRGLQIDEAALSAIDNTRPFVVGYYAKDPVNTLDVLDDIFTGTACWWGVSQLGLGMAGLVLPPAEVPDVPTVLDSTNILSIELSQMLPPAWRIRVEYERHWQVEGQFFDAIDEDQKQRWSAAGLVVTRQDESIKIAEPRAIDVPTVRSVAVTAADADFIADLFWNAWSVRREILDVRAWVDPREINLYDTISVNYMMFQKNYRIISAVRSIGGGPAQLQLWG